MVVAQWVSDVYLSIPFNFNNLKLFVYSSTLRFLFLPDYTHTNHGSIMKESIKTKVLINSVYLTKLHMSILFFHVNRDLQ